MAAPALSLYQQLGVSSDADLLTLRQAYRRCALECHPDRVDGDAGRMAALNAAWAVLSDPKQRSAYDRTLTAAAPVGPTVAPASSPRAQPQGPISRKDAWFRGIRLQCVRLGSEAARSASQALALRHRRAKAVYDIHIDSLVNSLGHDTEDRVRRAREASATPLDLGLAAALVGVRDRARSLAHQARIRGVDAALITQAELIDRVWDNLAHGVTRELEQSLGGNPRLLRSLTGRRV